MFSCLPKSFQRLVCLVVLIVNMLMMLMTGTKYALAQQSSSDQQELDNQFDPYATPKHSALYTASYAIIVGINDYSVNSRFDSLHYAVADAEDMSKVLSEYYDFPKDHITTILDKDATLPNIRHAIATLANGNKIKPTDRVLVFFSCHGHAIMQGNDEIGFIIPYGVKLDKSQDNSVYFDDCISMDSIQNTLNGCPAKHVLLIADMCYGNFSGQKGSFTSERPTLQNIDFNLSRRARQVLTAGTSTQKTREDSQWGHGALTFKLLEELKYLAKQSGNIFLASSLGYDLQFSVGNLTGNAQKPQIQNTNGTVGDFIFYVNPDKSISSGDSGNEIGKNKISPFRERIRGLYTAKKFQDINDLVNESIKNGDESEALIAKGYGDINTQQLREEIALITIVLKTEPQNEYAYVTRGTFRRKLGDLKLALDDYMKAHDLNPEDPDIYDGLGAMYVSQNKTSLAIDNFTKAISLEPNNAGYYNGRGVAYSHAGGDKQESAIADFKKAIKLKDSYAVAYNNLGNIYESQGKYSKATDSYNESIKFDPYYAFAYNNMGNLLCKLKKWKEAAVNYQKAINLDPKYAHAYLGLGNAHYNLNEVKTALANYTSSIVLAPTEADGYFNRGFLYSVQYDKIDAVADFKSFLKYTEPTSNVPQSYIDTAKRYINSSTITPVSIDNLEHTPALPKVSTLTPSLVNTSSLDAMSVVPEMSTYLNYLNAFDLRDLFREGELYTIFVPTTDAFATSPANTLRALTSAESQENVKLILKSYIVPGHRYTIADLKKMPSVLTKTGANLTTAAGSSIYIRYSGDEDLLEVSSVPFRSDTEGIKINHSGILATDGALYPVDTFFPISSSNSSQ